MISLVRTMISLCKVTANYDIIFTNLFLSLSAMTQHQLSQGVFMTDMGKNETSAVIYPLTQVEEIWKDGFHNEDYFTQHWTQLHYLKRALWHAGVQERHQQL